jgi:hypothetical protein
MSFPPVNTNFTAFQATRRDQKVQYQPVARSTVSSIPTSTTPPPSGLGTLGEELYLEGTGSVYKLAGFDQGYKWVEIGPVAPALPATVVASTTGVSYPAVGSASLGYFGSIANLATATYTLAADPGYITQTYVPNSASTTLQITTQLYLNAVGQVTANTQQLLSNIGIVVFDQNGANLFSWIVQSQGQGAYSQSIVLNAKVSSASYPSGIALKFNLIFDNTFATSGMGAALIGVIDATTLLVSQAAGTYMDTVFGEQN